MKLTNEQQTELREVALPLMQWLRSNCHPHVTAIVDSETTELLEGITTAGRTLKNTPSSLPDEN